MQPSVPLTDNGSSIHHGLNIELSPLPNAGEPAANTHSSNEASRSGTMLQKPTNPGAIELKSKLESSSQNLMRFAGQHQSMITPAAAKIMQNTLLATGAAGILASIVCVGPSIKYTVSYALGSGTAYEVEESRQAAVKWLLSLAGTISTTLLSGVGSALMSRYIPADILNNDQNVHDGNIIKSSSHLLEKMKEVVPNPANLEELTDSIIAEFDKRCSDSRPITPDSTQTKGDQFKQDMISVLPEEMRNNTDISETDKLSKIKQKITKAAEYMVGDNNSPIHYPSWVKTCDALSYSWAFITALGGDEESPPTPGDLKLQDQMVENTMKRLYDAAGYCNTGHVSRVMEGCKEALKALLLDNANLSEPPPQISADEFYDLHKADLDGIAKAVITDTKSVLHQFEKKLSQLPKDEDTIRHDYKQKATDFVKKRFIPKLINYMRSEHAALVAANPTLMDDLVEKLSSDSRFSIFLDNALANEENPSLRSFATMANL